MSRELVQGFNQNGVLPLPSLSITFAIYHNYNKQSFRSSAFWHIFLEGKKKATSVNRESCMASEELEIFLIGHFPTDTDFYVVPP